MAVSAAVTYATAPLVRQAMIKFGTLDVPNHRSSHSDPVPRGGGIACLAGVATGLLAGRSAVPIRHVTTIIGLTAIGFADDRSGGIHPMPRLLAQVGGGVLCGLRQSPLVGGLGAVAMPGVVNVVNFMDGINGISGTTALVWGAFAALDHTSTEPIKALGAVTAGAGLGFLPHNVPTADLFLGDTGSYLFGALMSIAVIDSMNEPVKTLRVGAPLLPYAVDAAQAIVRRGLRGEPLVEAHREHIYQRMVDSHTVSHTQMSLAHAATAATLGLLVRSPRRLIAVGGSVATLSLYISMPTLLDRLRRGVTS